MMTVESDDTLPLELYSLAVRNQIAPGTDQVGAGHAISVETGETGWKYEQRAATASLVATGGGLIFGGDANGRFRAFDHETGRVLWEINLGSSVTGFPIAYAVGGTQYIVAEHRDRGQPEILSSSDARATPEFREQPLCVRAARLRRTDSLFPP